MFGSNQSEAVGAASACTVSEAFRAPPAPVQASVYVALALSVAVASLPVRSRAPVQAPEAEQLFAFVTDQVSVVAAPRTTAVGLALNVMTGGGATAVIATCELRSPPAPLQVSTKVADAVGVIVS